MGMRARIRRLESKPEGRRCPECGLPPDGPGYTVYDRRPEGSEEFCSRCGRALWFVIEVAGDEAEGGGASVEWPM